MTDPLVEGWVEGVRSALTAPSLPRSRRESPGADRKWAIGDALLAVPEERRDEVAALAGLEKSDARSYWRTAQAWPSASRIVPVSWSVYRELSALGNRNELIVAGMKVRQAIALRTGREVDRRAVHRLPDDDVIDEVVRLMLSNRSRALVPQILERLNASKEGRRAARDRRSTAALRRLDEEIRILQKEMKKIRFAKSGKLRFMEVRRALLDTWVTVEEIAMLFNNPDGRGVASADDWRELAGRVSELRDVADKVATTILNTIDMSEAEAWDEADEWSIPELPGNGDGVIIDAEIVDED